MKKLLSIGICIVMALSCTAQAAAANTTQEDKYSSFKLIDDYRVIRNNFWYFSTFNTSSDTVSVIRFVNKEDTSDKRDFAFKDFLPGRAIAIGDDKEFESWTGIQRPGNSSSSFGNNDTRDYSTTGGTYQKVRIKLSDFNSYFNSDGSYDKTSVGETVTLHFGDPEVIDNGTYYSVLQMYSGAAYTSVTPDENGEVEFYVSLNIGQAVHFSTNYAWIKGLSVGGGGGTARTIAQICKGNVDLSTGGVSIKDATYLQRYLLKLETEPLSDLQKFNADVNNDGKIDIIDVTAIQKFLVD